MIEERPSYDTTQFIADVGGSLGFLLGLSVLGLIGILEHVSRKWEDRISNLYSHFLPPSAHPVLLRGLHQAAATEERETNTL